MIERSWGEVVAVLRDRPDVAAAQASADLLIRVQERWDGRVLPDLWIHDLRFVAPDDLGRHVDHVRVGWDGEAHVFTLRDRNGVVVVADRAEPAVLTWSAMRSCFSLSATNSQSCRGSIEPTRVRAR
ncbi:MAG: hypothetical protein R2733_17615 [Acidimicrobiales bacterium]